MERHLLFLLVVAFVLFAVSVALLWYGLRRKGRFIYITLYGMVGVSTFLFGVLDNLGLADSSVFEILAAFGVAAVGSLVCTALLHAWDVPWSLQEEANVARLNLHVVPLWGLAMSVASCIVHRWFVAVAIAAGAMVSAWLTHKWHQHLRELMPA